MTKVPTNDSLEELPLVREDDCLEFQNKFQTVFNRFLRRNKQHIDPSIHSGKSCSFSLAKRANILLHAYSIEKDNELLDMALQALRNMSKSRLYDHVSGGFFRTTYPESWHKSTFRKFLDDQGEFMAIYANAYKLTMDSSFLTIADGIFQYIMKYVRHPSGCFYNGEFQEDSFYAWTAEEIKSEIATISESVPEGFDQDLVFKIYSYHYTVRPMGNVEANAKLEGKNIPFVRISEEDTCAKFGITIDQLRTILGITNEALLKTRDQRSKIDKGRYIGSCSNGLILSVLAELANCYCDKRAEYLKAAKDLVDFILKHLYDEETGYLLRYRSISINNIGALEPLSAEPTEGNFEDYVAVIKGLLDYYKASDDRSILQWAVELQVKLNMKWSDSENKSHYLRPTTNETVRGALNLILLSNYFNNDDFRKHGYDMYKNLVKCKPCNSIQILICFGVDLFIVVGPDCKTTQRFLEICRKLYIPGMVLVRVDPLQPVQPYSQGRFKMIDGKPTVHISHGNFHRKPFTDPLMLELFLTRDYIEKRM